MVGTITVRLQRAAKIRCGEGRHLVRDPKFDGRTVESVHGKIELTHQAALIVDQIVVQVEPAHADHENLAARAERLPRGNHTRDNLQLARQIVVASGGAEGCRQCNRLQRRRHRAFGIDGAFGDTVIFRLQHMIAGLGHQRSQRRACRRRTK
jgi:hypothetical protein